MKEKLTKEKKKVTKEKKKKKKIVNSCSEITRMNIDPKCSRSIYRCKSYLICKRIKNEKGSR